MGLIEGVFDGFQWGLANIKNAWKALSETRLTKVVRLLRKSLKVVESRNH